MESENASSAVNQQERSALLQKSSETKRQIPQFNSKSISTLLGMLYTDGCVSLKGNSWRIYFSAKSKKLCEVFQSSLVESFQLESDRVRLSERNGLWQVTLTSKEVGDCLVNNFGTFKTLEESGEFPKHTKLPIEYLIRNNTVKEFLIAAFSCDGGVSFYPVYKDNTRWLNRNVFLACKPPSLREQYSLLLNYLKVDHKNNTRDEKIRCNSQTSINKFYNKVGFVSGVVATDHSKYWSGYDKQQILEYLLDSYKKPSKYFDYLELR